MLAKVSLFEFLSIWQILLYNHTRTQKFGYNILFLVTLVGSLGKPILVAPTAVLPLLEGAPIPLPP